MRICCGPTPGGVDYVLQGMSERLSKVVDVTIVYPNGVPTFWEFLQGKCREVHIDIRQLALPELASIDDDLNEKPRWLNGCATSG